MVIIGSVGKVRVAKETRITCMCYPWRYRLFRGVHGLGFRKDSYLDSRKIDVELTGEMWDIDISHR